MDMFGALADPTRRYILELLASSGELPATALYEHFPVSPQAVSQYLKVLREAHVVVMEKRAPKRVYCLNQETISQFEAWVRITRQRNMHQAKLGSQEGGRVCVLFPTIDTLLFPLHRACHKVRETLWRGPRWCFKRTRCGVNREVSMVGNNTG
ncbi:MAG: helix-turn-helix transcriptional regulator [Chloroflexi bacterium]|nr:MAG: helix-turn-helix transcriptional regulator [Chloroflexota bacterium]